VQPLGEIRDIDERAREHAAWGALLVARIDKDLAFSGRPVAVLSEYDAPVGTGVGQSNHYIAHIKIYLTISLVEGAGSRGQ
jgi:hypothetical protein